VEQIVTAVDIQALIPSWQRSPEGSPSVTPDDPELHEAAEQLSDFLVRSGMPTAVADIHPGWPMRVGAVSHEGKDRQPGSARPA
jgi:hypothetical protein